MSPQHFCPEEDRNKFRVLRSIFIICLISSGVGMGFFLYYLIGTAYTTTYGGYLIELDSTNPPYIAIIIFAVFILSIIGIRHTSSLENDLCF